MLAKLISLRRRVPLLLVALYGVELLDELIYGFHGAVMPRLKADLAINYTQVGLLFTLPSLVSVVLEPVIGVLGDTRYRKWLIVGGIAATAVSVAAVSFGNTYLVILLAFVVMATASGAYVNLSQGTLIDLDTDRAEHTMARWTLLGAVGVAVSPLIATAVFYLGFGWRGLYLALAGVAGFYVAVLARQPIVAGVAANPDGEGQRVSARALVANLLNALRHAELLRWVLLTELADLMLDKLLEVTGLYFHDVAGVSFTAASGAVALASIAGLVGSATLVPALERRSGMHLVRASAVVVLVAYVCFLLSPVIWIKYALIAAVGFCTASWYPTLRAKCYQTLPGKSGLVMAVTSLGNISSLFVPVALGRIADMVGLNWAMWLLVLGPLSLIIGATTARDSDKIRSD